MFENSPIQPFRIVMIAYRQFIESKILARFLLSEAISIHALIRLKSFWHTLVLGQNYLIGMYLTTGNYSHLFVYLKWRDILYFPIYLLVKMLETMSYWTYITLTIRALTILSFQSKIYLSITTTQKITHVPSASFQYGVHNITFNIYLKDLRKQTR